jgi:hypothetical protein
LQSVRAADCVASIGQPVRDIGTGKALGIVSRLCAGACSEEGSTVQGILAKAASRGFPVTLGTACGSSTRSPAAGASSPEARLGAHGRSSATLVRARPVM